MRSGWFTESVKWAHHLILLARWRKFSKWDALISVQRIGETTSLWLPQAYVRLTKHHLQLDIHRVIERSWVRFLLGDWISFFSISLCTSILSLFLLQYGLVSSNIKQQAERLPLTFDLIFATIRFQVKPHFTLLFTPIYLTICRNLSSSSLPDRHVGCVLR